MRRLVCAKVGGCHQVCFMVASYRSLRCSCRKKACLMQRSRGLATKLWSARIVTIHWMRSLWLLQTKLLAAAGWKWGCQPFSCPCAQNDCKMWLQKRIEKRFVRHVCFGNLFALFFFAKTFNSWRDQRVGKGELLSWQCSNLSSLTTSKLPLDMQRSYGHQGEGYRRGC